jgi:titin
VTIQLQTCARVISEAPVCGSWIEHREQFTPITWPSSPQQVQVAEVINEPAVEVSWKEPEDDGGSPIEEYVVEYQEEENPGPAFFRASTIGKASVAKFITVTGSARKVKVPNLTVGKRYSISVKAKNQSVDRYSEVTALRSPVITGFRAPTGLKVVSNISPSATFSWAAVAGITEYSVVCSGTGLTTVRGAFKTISATLKGLVVGKSYSCNVSSVKGSVTSSPSAAISVKLTAPLPAAPNISSAKQATATSATVTWVYASSAAKSIVGFYVETSKDGGKTWKRSALQKASAKSMTITGLAKKSTYQFRVLAVNESGTSPASKLSAKVLLK